MVDPSVALSSLELELPLEIEYATAALGAGRAPLDALARATALQWTLELLAGAELARTRIPSSAAVGVLLALASAFVEAPAREVGLWMTSAAFRAWLYRTRVHLVELRERGEPGPEITEHIALVPLMLAGQPSWEVHAPTEPIMIELPVRGVVPVVGDQRLRPAAAGLSVELHRTTDGLRITWGGETHALAEFVNGALRWRACREEVLRIEARTFVVGGAVEILTAADHGELAALRSPTEQTSKLDSEALDIELSRALGVLGWAWPEALIDIAYQFRGLLAIDMPLGHWNSASTRELPLILQLTIRPRGNPFLLAESIVHETAHVRLDEASFLQALIVDDGRRIYRHPWRPDLRPITGVLLGAHAFLSVALFYRRCLTVFRDQPFLLREFDTRMREVGEALDMLERHAEFTSAGERIFAAMRRLHGARGGSDAL